MADKEVSILGTPKEQRGYEEIIKDSEEKLGFPCTGVKYGTDGRSFICMNCGSGMIFIDKLLTCETCKRKGIYL